MSCDEVLAVDSDMNRGKLKRYFAWCVAIVLAVATTIVAYRIVVTAWPGRYAAAPVSVFGTTSKVVGWTMPGWGQQPSRIYNTAIQFAYAVDGVRYERNYYSSSAARMPFDEVDGRRVIYYDTAHPERYAYIVPSPAQALALIVLAAATSGVIYAFIHKFLFA